MRRSRQRANAAFAAARRKREAAAKRAARRSGNLRAERRAASGDARYARSARPRRRQRQR